MFRARAAGLVGCLAALVSAGAAHAAIAPTVDCATYEPETNTLMSIWGYNGDDTVDIPIGSDNFFSPGVLTRGQPTTFLPGPHPNLFETQFQVSASQPQITWFLDGNSQAVNAHGALAEGAGTVPQCAMVWRGDWQPGQSYFVFDVVAHDGGSWVAVAEPGAAEPGTDPVWQALASHGPQGQIGPAGAIGRGCPGARRTLR